MTVSYLTYTLQTGYIHHWLVAGPQTIPCPHPTGVTGDTFKQRMARRFYQPDSQIARQPIEGGLLTVDDHDFFWTYVHCGDDHFVDLSTTAAACSYLRTWAYTQLTLPAAEPLTFLLTTTGPADVWLNGRHVHRHLDIGHPSNTEAFQSPRKETRYELLVRFEATAADETPYAMALQVVEAPTGTRIELPTPIKEVERHYAFETLFERAYLEREVHGARDPIVVRWPADLSGQRTVNLRLQSPSGPIYAESWTEAGAGAAVQLSQGLKLRDSPYRVVVMPQAEAFYNQGMRLQRQIGLWTLKSTYSDAYYGTQETRSQEALEYAVTEQQGLFAEIAKMALGRWSDVKAQIIQDTLHRVEQHLTGTPTYLVALLGMAYRYVDNPSFPADLRPALQTCFLNYKYRATDPNHTQSQARQILLYTAELLAGQRYPDQIFSGTNQPGRWHQSEGSRKALTWLSERGRTGFSEWDSPAAFEAMIVALSHLVDLANARQIREMAAVILDKLLFSLALNSYRGVFGSTHGKTDTASLKSGRLAPTAGISRLLWGLNGFNHHLQGVVSLACAPTYEVPAIIQAVALDRPEALWSRECHQAQTARSEIQEPAAATVHKTTYKTPDYMLCSVQDYRPGRPGREEHIWQATLGPEAVVFVNHPTCMSQSDAWQPNFWRGNGRLPRVAQWKEVLLALHRLPEDDWLGFTHAYFPTYAFDEHVLQENWAFARHGHGYLALTAMQPLQLMTEGDSAYRELRSDGQFNIWLCHLGRSEQDGSFAEFQQQILRLNIKVEPLAVRCNTLRGETLTFGWKGPLQVNGQEQRLTAFQHYESPYCLAEMGRPDMEICYGDYGMKLNFALA